MPNLQLSDNPPHALHRSLAYRRSEADKECVIRRSVATSSPERIAEKIKARVGVLPFPLAILAIHYLRLLWMKLQTTFFKAQLYLSMQ